MIRKTGENERRIIERLAKKIVNNIQRQQSYRDLRKLNPVDDFVFQDSANAAFGRPILEIPGTRTQVAIVEGTVADDSPEKESVRSLLEQEIIVRGGPETPVNKVAYKTDVINAHAPMFFVEDDDFDAAIVMSPTNSAYFWHNN